MTEETNERESEGSDLERAFYEDPYIDGLAKEGYNVRYSPPPSDLEIAVKLALAGLAFCGMLWGCDYLASKVNPQHPNFKHESPYQNYSTQQK